MRDGKPTIEVLVGMIASGKSTYARRRADEGALVIAHDDLTQMLHARYRYEPDLRGLYRKMEELLAKAAIEEGRDVVIDRTHLTRESRDRWVSFARYPRFPAWAQPPVVAVCFPIERAEIHAHRRFAADPRGRSLNEWMGVAVHHAGQAEAEPLSEDEGFAAILEADNA